VVRNSAKFRSAEIGRELDKVKGKGRRGRGEGKRKKGK
jgi:hypothetical protein